MNCAVHAELEAKGFCRNCGKAMCPGCARDVKGMLYCEDCLAATATAARPAGEGNPATAALLGILPGLGAVYNGEYVKALIHLMVFGGLITMLERGHAEGFFIPLFIGFLIYQPVEAYKTARARQLGQPLPNPLSTIGQGQPIGAFVLIGFGVLLLVSRMDWFWERFVDYLFPLAFIALGIFLMTRRMSGANS
jgi:hypothetical protein